MGHGAFAPSGHAQVAGFPDGHSSNAATLSVTKWQNNQMTATRLRNRRAIFTVDLRLNSAIRGCQTYRALCDDAIRTNPLWSDAGRFRTLLNALRSYLS